MSKSNVAVEDVFITKDNKTMKEVKVVIDQDSNELVIIDLKKEDCEDKVIRRCLIGGNVFFSVLFMLCLTIGDIKILALCLAMVLGAWAALNDTLYFERKKGRSIAGTLLDEENFMDKIKKIRSLIK